ncbi:hypothetical protein K491DRAFT_448583 [Lophiostoma macrostomum CBS 122681]|uniref:Uncharacterized protein n=1 Tax=Lophiostoma macrostomum CBS 122681 TaxID=1314788 RepID=A0A6A6TNG6_9PLEO|nr:hypothetical protein K491DRAFT_448583 [Lophiostoma macrostomum CBS 122681]
MPQLLRKPPNVFACLLCSTLLPRHLSRQRRSADDCCPPNSGGELYDAGPSGCEFADSLATCCRSANHSTKYSAFRGAERSCQTSRLRPLPEPLACVRRIAPADDPAPGPLAMRMADPMRLSVI